MKIVIITCPRSGSRWLARSIASSGGFENLDEILNPENPLPEGATDRENWVGVYHAYQLGEDLIKPIVFEWMAQDYKIIHLKRRDTFRQFISERLAITENNWDKGPYSLDTKLSITLEEFFKYLTVLLKYQWLVERSLSVSPFPASHPNLPRKNMRITTVYYEDLLNDPLTVSALGRFLEVPLEMDSGVSQTQMVMPPLCYVDPNCPDYDSFKMLSARFKPHG